MSRAQKKVHSPKWKCISEIKRMIRMGKTRDECIGYAVDVCDYSETTAEHYYAEACNEMKKSIAAYADKIAEKNIDKLIALIDKAYDSGKLGDAIKAIDTLNKMSGLYTTKIDIEDNNTIFKVSLNES